MWQRERAKEKKTEEYYVRDGDWFAYAYMHVYTFTILITMKTKEQRKLFECTYISSEC
jgi:surface polysaccharide O-acyltransferase-like enzyme